MTLLSHLQTLTSEVNGVSVIWPYSIKNTKRWVPFEAKDEGIACVDDAARASILAFKVGDIEQARKWLEFVHYMTDRTGKVANWIKEDGSINVNGTTSYRGGEFWQARALHAHAVAYKTTGDEANLNEYWKIYRQTKPQTNKALAIKLLAEMEMNEAGVYNSLEVPPFDRWYFPDDLWGWHQLEVGAKLLFLPRRSGYMQRNTIVNIFERYVRPIVDAGFYDNWHTKTKERLCPYSVSPIVRALAVLVKREPQYTDLLEKSYNWFFGDNDINKAIYDPETGICFDSLKNKNAGAESSAEAGLTYLAVEGTLTKDSEPELASTP